MTVTPDVSFTLADRYEALDGDVLVTGIQALARVPIDQMRADARRGWRTKSFVSGYQGSPLGGFDRELLANPKLLAEHGVTLWPGINEELAATAVAGSQLASTMRTSNVDGVAGYWYGKAPGLERAGDAIRHAVFAGTARKGGVLALIGDDPACKSSTVPSRSDALVAALGFPLLDPGTMQDVLDLGRHGIEMSRASGLWSGLKIVTAVADGSGYADIALDRLHPVTPTMDRNGSPWEPMLSGFVIAPTSLQQEAEVFGPRLEMAAAYIEANQINRVMVSAPNAWLTIVASGYTAEVVIDALGMLGLTPEKAADLGVRVVKLRAIHPFDTSIIRQAARGVSTVLVIEEKRAYIETLVRDALYPTPDRPAVLGKRDGAGAVLVPDSGALGADALVEPLRRVLLTNIASERLARPRQRIALSLHVDSSAVRTAYFCSGCPHNTSTVVPDGSFVGIGIGCHGMVGGLGREDRGEFTSICQMGGEGAHWIGMAPYVDTPHIFQNIGDGTFFHSGQLAVQAAVSAGVTITYKLLYNSAVAMTGGQDATGQLSVPQVVDKLRAEGVKQIIVTTDDPDKYKGVTLGERASVRHRDDIIAAQEELRAVSGVTVLIHDQQCAAEKRRDRKRGILPTPTTRIVIDHRVCEGCGDCGVKSNCLSLTPVETEYGRKTTIDQASCNIDMSCLKGDCPAFVTITPGKRGRRASKAGWSGELPNPTPVVPTDGSVVRMPGIGGTGVVTVSQILLAAARIDGLEASAVDQTGLSQKAGPVVSTVTLGNPAPGRVHALLAFDVLSSVTPANLEGLDTEWSHVVANSTVTPTGRMIGKVSAPPVDLTPYRSEFVQRSRSTSFVDATGLTVGLLGTGVTSNVFLVGVAFQQGLLPLSADAINRAIELNGTAVEANKESFMWGRRWVANPTAVEAAAAAAVRQPAPTDGLDDLRADHQQTDHQRDDDLVALVADRRCELRLYQDERYAKRYVDVVRKTAAVDRELARIVATQLYRVMAYKDEYEVARLLVGGASRIEQSFGGPVDSTTFNLHPPTLRAMGMGRKLAFGPAARPALVALSRMKRLRGTPADPFGRASLRRTERQLVEEYIQLVDRLLGMVRSDRARALRVAGLMDMVRGFESVKERNLAAYRTALEAELAGA